MIVTLSALVLAGMQTEEPERVAATWIGEQCGTQLNGQALDPADLESLAKGWAREGREVHIRGGKNMPYRCIGGTLFAMQTAGVVRGRFISEPQEMVTVEIPVGRCRVVIDGKRVTFREYRMAARSWHQTQPRIYLKPDPEARYPCVDRMLKILKEEKVGNLGFVGNALAE